MNSGAAAGAAGRTTRAGPYGPVVVLQGMELVAISLAAACQAATLIQAAGGLWRQQRLAAGAPWEAEAMTAAATGPFPVAPAEQQQQQLLLVPAPAPAAAVRPPAPGLQHVTNAALVVGLLCGAALRYLQPRLAGGRPQVTPTAEAAVRLAAVEVAAQQTAAQLAATARQIDKLQARVRLATSDLKAPLRGVQATAAQHAGALLQLSGAQAELQRQLEGGQELFGALQGLAAKQFKVSIEALQQLKQSQVQLSSSTSKAVAGLQQQQAELQQQQQRLQQLLLRQQQQLRSLEAETAWAKQRQQQTGHTTSNSSEAGGTSHSSRSTASVIPPDPWHAAAAGNGVQEDRAASHHAAGNSSSCDSHGSHGSNHNPTTSSSSSMSPSDVHTATASRQHLEDHAGSRGAATPEATPGSLPRAAADLAHNSTAAATF